MGRKKKNSEDQEPVVIPLDLDEEIEEYEQAAEVAKEGRLDLRQLKEMSINELSRWRVPWGSRTPPGCDART